MHNHSRAFSQVLKEALECADAGAYMASRVIEGREKFARVDAALRKGTVYEILQSMLCRFSPLLPCLS